MIATNVCAMRLTICISPVLRRTQKQRDALRFCVMGGAHVGLASLHGKKGSKLGCTSPFDEWAPLLPRHWPRTPKLQQYDLVSSTSTILLSPGWISVGSQARPVQSVLGSQTTDSYGWEQTNSSLSHAAWMFYSCCCCSGCGRLSLCIMCLVALRSDLPRDPREPTSGSPPSYTGCKHLRGTSLDCCSATTAKTTHTDIHNLFGAFWASNS